MKQASPVSHALAERVMSAVDNYTADLIEHAKIVNDDKFYIQWDYWNNSTPVKGVRCIRIRLYGSGLTMSFVNGWLGGLLNILAPLNGGYTIRTDRVGRQVGYANHKGIINNSLLVKYQSDGHRFPYRKGSWDGEYVLNCKVGEKPDWPVTTISLTDSFKVPNG